MKFPATLLLGLLISATTYAQDSTDTKSKVRKSPYEPVDRAVTPKPNPFQQMGLNLDLTLFG